MRFGIIEFKGSYGVSDLSYVLQQMMNYDVNRIWWEDEDPDFSDIDALILPAGAAFYDYLRPGAFAARTEIMRHVIDYAAKGGFVFGFGNGFQILCEAGLLPGALLKNKSGTFVSGNTWVRADNNYSIVNVDLDKTKPVKLPVAHLFGCYFVDQEKLIRMRMNDQILFRYCDNNGRISRRVCPDGAIENIAGICSDQKNVIGMMPLPDRAVDDETGNTDGYKIFRSILKNFVVL